MNIEHNVEQELQSMNSPLAGLSKKMPHVVPAGYFLGLAGNALRSVKAQAVPQDYFELLPAAMLHAAKAAEGIAVPIVQRRKIIALPAVRWAAAAVFLVALAMGGGKLYQRAQSPERVIATLPSGALDAYVEAHPDVLEADLVVQESVASLDAPDLSGLSAEELEAYLAESAWTE